MIVQPHQTVYKKTTTGATQQWHQEIQGSTYRTVSGQVGGKLVTSEWTQCEATNVGRSNERTPEEQAVFEVAANYKKKTDKDYHLTQEAAQAGGSKIFECMLAYEYKKRLEKKVSKAHPQFSYDGIYSQPKLNGMRCLIKADGMWSRKGKPIVSCPHIIKDLEDVFIANPNLVLDGELYNHEFKDDFNEIMSIFKQLKPTAEDLAKSEQYGQFHIYDATVTEGKIEDDTLKMTLTVDSVYADRLKFIEMVATACPKYIKLTETIEINYITELDYAYEKYAAQGYEGQMIRANAKYDNDRSWSLLKRKDFFDAEYELIDILPGLGNWAGKAKRAVLRTADGREFGAGITGTMEFCAALLAKKHEYIGKPTTVNYQILTPDGIPLFPRCKEFDRIDI